MLNLLLFNYLLLVDDFIKLFYPYGYNDIILYFISKSTFCVNICNFDKCLLYFVLL